MPALTEEHIALLGPPVLPFERSNKPPFDIDDLRSKGEAHNDEFQYAIHNGIDNGLPTPYLEVTIEERDEKRILEGRKFKEKCYLWVIDTTSVKIILERTPNVLRGAAVRPSKGIVCHTNITACEPALAGGEMYFCEDGNIYINFASDRYGYRGSDERKKRVIEVLEYMQYKNIKILKEFFY